MRPTTPPPLEQQLRDISRRGLIAMGVEPTEEQSTKLIEVAKGYVDFHAIGQTSLMPMLYVLHRKSAVGEPQMTIFALAGGFNSSVEKGAALIHCGRQVASNGDTPMAAVLVAEAWTAVDATPRKYLMPADDPDRQEVIFVSSLTAARRIMHTDRSVQRDAANGIVLVGDWRQYDNVAFSFLEKFYEGWALGVQQNHPRSKR